MKSLTWKKFLKMHISSIYAMDFFTVDTISNARFYVLFVISHKTREIIHFAITQNPVKEFVRQQIIILEEKLPSSVYLIHDNAGQFGIDYETFEIQEVRTSFGAPNMNSIAERFVGSVRRETLDYFIILGQRQLEKVLTENVRYYNMQRTHQGIEQKVPSGYKVQNDGQIHKELVPCIKNYPPIFGNLSYAAIF